MRAPVALLGILVLGAALRFVRLGDVPDGFNIDEASIVLNARCIVETGRDQWGAPWPFYFRSLDDYKDPLLLYGVAATSLAAGDDVRGARVFTALCGFVSLLGAWLLGREVLGSNRGALLATGLLAVSPWHLHYSRIAWMAITLVLLHTFAAWLLLRGLRGAREARGPDPTWSLGLGGALLGLTLWTYSPAKLWVPLLGGAFIAVAWLDARRWPWSAHSTAAGLAGFTLAAAPFLMAYLEQRQAINLRFDQVSVFAPGGGGLAAVARGWLLGLSPDFLFLTGDPNERHSPPWVGQMLVAEAPLLVAGLVALWRDGTPARRLVVAWVLLAPLLGALTRDPPHATRTIALLPALQLATARGVLAAVHARGEPMRRIVSVALAACAGFATWAHFTAPRRIGPDAWRPDLTRVVETAHGLGQGGEVHFLRATLVMSVDWLYLRRVPPPVIQANARRDPLVYDPFDDAGTFDLAGADCRCDGHDLRPGDLLVSAPGDEVHGLRLLADDHVARYWRVP